MGNAMPTPQTALPLAGIKVLDLTLARAGPTCVRHLADWGADVLRIEPPDAGAGEITGKHDGFDMQNLHRNKRCMRLDLKTPEGQEVFRRLAADADVLVENMRAPVKFKLKVDYETLRALNPRLVYGSISGFGQDGPYAARAGVDQIVQGMGGLMSITGLPGQGPVRVGIAVADMAAGTILALGVMMALFQRHSTGEGRWVQTSLLESMIFMADFQAARWLLAGEVPGPAGNDHPTGIPTGVYPTQDRPITIAASSGRHWARLCEVLDRPDWLDREEWSTGPGRSLHRAVINAAISEVTQTMPSAHWLARLEPAGIPAGPINTMDQVFADPQVQHLKMAQPVHHPRLGPQQLVGTPINMAGIEDAIRLPTPDGGQHTEEVLAALGYDAASIAALKAKGVV
jgi:formyl-CoA transferase